MGLAAGSVGGGGVAVAVLAATVKDGSGVGVGCKGGDVWVGVLVGVMISAVGGGAGLRLPQPPFAPMATTTIRRIASQVGLLLIIGPI